MNVLMVYAHQDPQSFGAALHSRALKFFESRGDTVVVSDLYASGFHAVAEKWDFKASGGPHENYMLEQKRVADGGEDGFAEDIQQEIRRLRDADLLVLEFPVWWHAPPAIMKGWLDKVFALGVVWDGNHRYEAGFMHGKQALVIAGAGDSESLYQADNLHKASLIQYLYPLLHGTLAHSGFDVLQPYSAYNLTVASDEERQSKVDGLDQFLDSSIDTPNFLYKHSKDPNS